MKLFHSLALLFAAELLAGPSWAKHEVAVPPAPVVTVYAMRDCPACRRVQQDVRRKTEYDFRFEYEKQPAWVTEYPYIVWTGKDGRKYFVAGWEDFETWEAAWRRTQ